MKLTIVYLKDINPKISVRGRFDSVFFFFFCTFGADLLECDKAETEKGRYYHDLGTISLFSVLRSLKIMLSYTEPIICSYSLKSF